MSTKQIDELKARIVAELPVQAKIAGADLAALIKNRVVQTGRNADGEAFSAYSEKEVPAFFYLGRSRSAGADQRVREKAKKREAISYKEFRQINGLNTDKKNFEFTGAMWRGIEVQETKRGAVSVVVIAGGSKDVQDKLAYASEAEKINILKPSKGEIGIIENNLSAWLAGVLKQGLK